MADPIRILDEAVINRIAAGEVVERPVSVVKELVENSIDAGGTSIRIDIENGGKKLIRVQDNGSGMRHDDAFLALERHATSKLHTEKDLVGVATMGFRGEALASIAAVSRMKLMSADGIDPAGTEIVIEGGVLRKSERAGMAQGTVIEVHNLFYNVPVRRKFLKGPKVEAGHIQELITKLSLAFPEVAVTYREDGRVKLGTPAVRNTLERIQTLYSRDVRENLIRVEYSVDEARLHGYVARPPYARSNMRSVQTFVNGRPVRDRLINAAVSRAFSNLMERGRYPLAILFLELPPDQVDVNVHPQKAEVRFIHPNPIFNLILDGVHEALTGAPFNPPPGPPEPIRPRPPTTPVSRHVQDERTPEEPLAGPPPMKTPPPPPSSSTSSRRDAPPTEAPSPEPPAPLDDRPGRFSSLGILGALPDSFLVLYSDDELIVLDHHAAHERVLFEDLKRSVHGGARFAGQGLLIPKVLEFSPVEARALGIHLHVLQGVGFDMEEFGENDFVVKGVPGWLGNTDLDDFFHALVDVMVDTGTRGDPERLQEELLRSMACKTAVKETSALHPQEIRALLKDLDRTGTIEVCPHGRPMMVKMPLKEIRKKMRRR